MAYWFGSIVTVNFPFNELFLYEWHIIISAALVTTETKEIRVGNATPACRYGKSYTRVAPSTTVFVNYRCMLGVFLCRISTPRRLQLSHLGLKQVVTDPHLRIVLGVADNTVLVDHNVGMSRFHPRMHT